MIGIPLYKPFSFADHPGGWDMPMTINYTLNLLRWNRGVLVNHLMDEYKETLDEAVRIYEKDETEIFADITRQAAQLVRARVSRGGALCLELN